MNFPGWMQDIYKTVPPDRSSKMTEQPSPKNTFWGAGVALATEQPSFVTHSSGKETMFFLFPHILSSIVFPFSCPATPNYSPLSCALTHGHGSSRGKQWMRGGEECSEEQPVTYCSRNPGVG